MFKHKIELVTMQDIVNFVAAVENANGSVKLIDDSGFCVNGKSLLGAAASVEWNNLYVLSDEDIYTKILNFICE